MTLLAKAAAKSWSSTLRLPKSTLPPRPAPADTSTYLKRCTDNLYAWQRRDRAAQIPFTLHDGPPYANGDLHVGHALNKILKDIICRTELLKGRRVDYVPGWDCHGLPIEQKAFEHHGWTIGNQPDATSIRTAATAFADKTVKKQMDDFKAWGIMADWQNHWKTMDRDFELRQLSVFQTMAKNGLIYRKHKPVYWSPSSRTALAEAELEYKNDHVSTAVLVKFPLNPAWQEDQHEPLFAVIWTTTPWTLPANQALAINRELEYTIVRSPEHGKLLVAEARLPFLQEHIGHPLETLGRVDVEELIASHYNGPPMLEKDIFERPIVHANFVSADAGTGIVHCAPGHGMEDYDALQPFIRSGHVKVKAPVDEEGKFTEDALPSSPSVLNEKAVHGEGSAAMIAGLRNCGSLITAYEYSHKYPYDWRTKQPILVRATAQWFADVSSIKEDALRALEDVRFRPSTGQSRLKSFVANRSEWCISRQRSWGVPIPALYHKTTGEAMLSDESVAHIIRTIGERGINSWWSDPLHEKAWIAPDLDASEYRRGTDTMDVWFDSGTSWTHMLATKEMTSPPVADIYLEGTDQHRGWFQSSLLTKVAYEKSTNAESIPSAPFRSLITHGFTLDGAGKKMSKSIGNVVTPDQIITGDFASSDVTPTVSKVSKSKNGKNSKQLPRNKKAKQGSGSLGPDALRLWVASSDWTKDVIVSERVVKTVHAALHKYRVTLKLLLGALDGFNPNAAFEYSKMNRVDQIALLHLHQVTKAVQATCLELEYHKAITAINKWINADLSGFYIEAIKDILYCESPASARRQSAQTALYHILTQIQGMLAPFTPLLVEESWQHCPESIKANALNPLMRVWDGSPEQWYDQRLENAQLPLVASINSAVKAAQERARSDKKMGSSLESDCWLYLNDADDSLEGWTADLKEILVVSDLRLINPSTSSGDGIPRGAEQKDFHDLANANPNIIKDFIQEQVKNTIVPQQAWVYSEKVMALDGKCLGVAIVTQPNGLKCARCWKYAVVPEPILAFGDSEEVDHNHDEGLCARCKDVAR